MSYGAYVQACIDERRDAALHGHSWEDGAERYASLHFPDFPEHRVLEVLAELHWPARSVSVSEVLRAVKVRVTPAEMRAWSEEMDSWQPVRSGS
jgi:hypothetical protein